MTPNFIKSTRRTTITLNRKQLEDILVWQMGWEHIDVTAFWRLARAHRNPNPQPSFKK